MSPVREKQPALPSTRRKILRAGFGLPVLTVVASGSALAQTSTTCLARQVANPTFPAVTDADTPTGYRRVQLGRVTSGLGVHTYYVSGNAIAALGIAIGGSYGVTAGKYQLFNIGTNMEVGPPSTGAPAGFITGGGKWAVLRFDASGKIVGVGQPPVGTTGQSAAIASCWSSLAVA